MGGTFLRFRDAIRGFSIEVYQISEYNNIYEVSKLMGINIL